MCMYEKMCMFYSFSASRKILFLLKHTLVLPFIPRSFSTLNFSLRKFENDSRSTRVRARVQDARGRLSSNLNQHHQTRLDRCNCWCCDLMVHSSPCPLCLSCPPRVSSFSFRFRFYSIKPALQLATSASRRFLTKIESAICKLPSLPLSPLFHHLILTPIDAAGHSLAVFPRRVAMFRVWIMTACRLRADISCGKRRKFADL